jgi:hypothetical protein
MFTGPHTELRELDHRINDGIDVTLLWDPHTDRTFVAVEDHRRGESFEFGIRAVDALDAFHHPYAYREHEYDDHALVS